MSRPRSPLTGTRCPCSMRGAANVCNSLMPSTSCSQAKLWVRLVTGSVILMTSRARKTGFRCLPAAPKPSCIRVGCKPRSVAVWSAMHVRVAPVSRRRVPATGEGMARPAFCKASAVAAATPHSQKSCGPQASRISGPKTEVNFTFGGLACCCCFRSACLALRAPSRRSCLA